jgi:hypothetical protein
VDWLGEFRSLEQARRRFFDKLLDYWDFGTYILKVARKSGFWHVYLKTGTIIPESGTIIVPKPGWIIDSALYHTREANFSFTLIKNMNFSRFPTDFKKKNASWDGSLAS